VNGPGIAIPRGGKAPVCLALPGCGTALGVVAGALEVLASSYRFEAVGGTSGGGLVALALATGMTPRDASEIGAMILVRKDLLDHHMPFIDEKTGLFRGQKIEGILQDIFGNARMGDLQTPARVTVSSMWTRKPAVVCSVAHPDVLVWRAARATMSIQRFFSLSRLRSDNARTYGDGGLLLNVPSGLWDDRVAATMTLRFARHERTHTVQELIRNADGDGPGEVRPVRNTLDVDIASFSMMLNGSASSWPSRKTSSFEVILDDDADALSFGLKLAEVERRRQAGMRSARLFLSR